MRRLRRALLPNRLHEFRAVLAQDALHAADGVALAVQQMANAAQQFDVVGTVITPSAAAFHRLDFAKTAFPKTQHVLRQIELIRHFTDGAKGVRRLVIQSGLTPCWNKTRYWNERSAQLCSAWPLMRCLRIADGLNTITRRGEIGTSLPVLGLRPIRWPFLRTTNEPNEDSFTVSPRSRQSVISLSTNSTSEADSVRERPTF